jgi:hypothetical protein
MRYIALVPSTTDEEFRAEVNDPKPMSHSCYWRAISSLNFEWRGSVEVRDASGKRSSRIAAPARPKALPKIGDANRSVGLGVRELGAHDSPETYQCRSEHWRK